MGLQEMWRIICLGGTGLTTTITSTKYGQTVELDSGAAGPSFSYTTGAAGVGLGELTTPQLQVHMD